MKAMIVAVCLCSIVLALGCGGDGGGPSDTAASLTEAGWALFEKGQFGQAIEKFVEALGLDATYADAYNGLGWSYANLDSLANSLHNFGMCVTHDDELAEGYAGCAPVYRDYETQAAHFDSAVAFASMALAEDSEFEFSHDVSFTWEDLRVIKAQSYFGMGEFLLAKAEVDTLGGKTLDPESPTFVEDLAEEIERLEDRFD